MELGSNFDLNVADLKQEKENLKKYLQSWNPVYVDSGRSAIRLLKEKIPRGKILLPYYICRSVVDSFLGSYDIGYYQINRDLRIDIEYLEKQINKSVTAVFLMHYFGKMQDEAILKRIRELQNRYHFIIVEDTTHCILTNKRTIGDYCVCSLRKWFSVPDGGVIYAGKDTGLLQPGVKRSASQVTEAMLLKNLYLNTGTDCNVLYRNIFAECEKKLDIQEKSYDMSDMSSTLLECMNLKKISEKRKHNRDYLSSNIKHKDITVVYPAGETDYVPFVFPVLVKDRNRFRSYLMEHHIYCAVHWPIETEEQQKNMEASFLSNHLLSLPIDQRYTEIEMEYMANIINNYS